ncbi:MAG: secretin and TonB N-terminal domain-containing protein, partial [Rikenellaceae bacterium]
MNKNFRNKIIIVFILFFSLSAYSLQAANVRNVTISLLQQVKEKKVTINIKNRPIREILVEIKKQTSINFVLNAEISKTIGNLSLEVKNVTVEEALRTLLKGSNFDFELTNNYITIV